MSQKLVKAKLISLDNPKEEIVFMFNPTQLQFSRSIQTNQNGGARSSEGIPKVSFAHPNPYSLKIQNIMLDTYEEGKSVMPEIEKFKKTVEFSTQGRGRHKRPSIFLFTWGDQKYLRCFVKTLSYNLTMFLPSGEPVRATVNLDLEEVDEINEPGNTGAPRSTPHRTTAPRPSATGC